jgi:hypothetical protein
MLSASTLADELKKVGNASTEIAAVQGWADAVSLFFLDAAAAGAPIAPLAVTPAKSALASGLVGFSAGGQAAGKIQTAMVNFWAAIVPTVAWPSALAIVPPVALASLASTLTQAFDANRSAPDTDTAFSAIALVLAAACVGGTVAFPGVPTPTPIL